MEELKPCPFCGHPRSRLMSKREYCKDVEHNVAIRFAFWRKCNKCGATSSIVKTEPVYWVHYDSGDEWAKPWREQANEAWNRRANECDHDELASIAEEIGALSYISDDLSASDLRKIEREILDAIGEEQA